jgi:hypothetical protein
MKVRVSDKNTSSDRGLSQNRIGQEMEADTMEEAEIYDEAGGEEVMEDMDHAKLKKRVAGNCHRNRN